MPRKLFPERQVKTKTPPRSDILRRKTTSPPRERPLPITECSGFAAGVRSLQRRAVR
jgi:hypothetical protein